MKSSLAASLASLLLAGNALAADAFRIESEAQFVGDYDDRIERMAPGVYQIVKGPLAGKTISLGETGLAYDLAALRAHIPQSRRERAQAKAQIRRLETEQARFAQLRARTGPTKASRSDAFPCQYQPLDGAPIYYYGSATVTATTELYMLRSDGLFNPYYARASAGAGGTVYTPFGVPADVSLLAYAVAHERQLGQIITRQQQGVQSASVATGYVYSGPAFFHDLFASASVHGRGNCYGYVSISDSMTPGF